MHVGAPETAPPRGGERRWLMLTLGTAAQTSSSMPSCTECRIWSRCCAARIT